MSKQAKIFWTSYADLMTTLFFIMLVLLVLTIAMMKRQQKATEEQLKRIVEIQNSVKELDTTYFEYQEMHKRYKLKIDVNFRGNSHDINDIPLDLRMDLQTAGQNIFSKMETLISENKDVNYLLIVEGNAQKNNDNYLVNPDAGYVLSFKRSLALVNYWKSNNINFSSFNNCEILIVGSGYFGKSREVNENENRKFTIQITPKIGKIEN
jgi:hypothetical protein